MIGGSVRIRIQNGAVIIHQPFEDGIISDRALSTKRTQQSGIFRALCENTRPGEVIMDVTEIGIQLWESYAFEKQYTVSEMCDTMEVCANGSTYSV
jgi:hypothetical protein